MSQGRISYLWYLFAFEGRINRARYWAHAGLVLFVALPALIGIAMIPRSLEGMGDPAVTEALQGGFALLTVAVFATLMVSILAVGAKRWHDRNKSGWWLLLNFVPVVGPLWTFVECGCMRGTEGPNRHGPDPLAPPVETVFE